MTCSVEIEGHGICKETGVRVATVKARYWRGIHSELMTHRVFSRNAASSRAIPTKKTLAMILRDMAGPIHWGNNIPGMQAKDELTGWKLLAAKTIWRVSGIFAVFFAYLGMHLGMHKQTINRIVEPWTYITTVITSTQWENFFALRRHPDAQPEFRELAEAIYEALLKSTPKEYTSGDWYIPYILEGERQIYSRDDLLKISVARCASTSYATVDGNLMTRDKATKLYDKLVGSAPLHASPTEHQGRFDFATKSPGQFEWANPELHGNLIGMIQYRKTLQNENHPG